MAAIQTDTHLVLSATEMNSRWYYEREKLRMFPAFVLVGRNSDIVAAEGTLDTQYNNRYAMRIELASYPFSLPKVWPKDWTIHPDCPHKYNDGSICIMRSDQWQRNFTIAL